MKHDATAATAADQWLLGNPNIRHLGLATKRVIMRLGHADTRENNQALFSKRSLYSQFLSISYMERIAVPCVPEAYGCLVLSSPITTLSQQQIDCFACVFYDF